MAVSFLVPCLAVRGREPPASKSPTSGCGVVRGTGRSCWTTSRRRASRPSSRHPARSAANPIASRPTRASHFRVPSFSAWASCWSRKKPSGSSRKTPRNKDVLFPYLNGEDLNSRPDQSPSRWVINFFDWPIEKAMPYPDCFRIIEEKVKPERMKNKRKVRAERWWQFAERQISLYRSLEGWDRIIVCSEVTKHLVFHFLPTDWVYSANVDVFPLGEPSLFALLQSAFHDGWGTVLSAKIQGSGGPIEQARDEILKLPPLGPLPPSRLDFLPEDFPLQGLAFIGMRRSPVFRVPGRPVPIH